MGFWKALGFDEASRRKRDDARSEKARQRKKDWTEKIDRWAMSKQGDEKLDELVAIGKVESERVERFRQHRALEEARLDEIEYRLRRGLMTFEEEAAVRQRLAKRRGKGYSAGLLVATGGVGAIFRARGLGKDRRLAEALERLERDQARRENRGIPVYYPE